MMTLPASISAPLRTIGLIAALSAPAIMATPASAGLLINPQGIFLTEPEVSPYQAGAGQRSFGSPATGFRRFGRNGFFPTPVDPTVPASGQSRPSEALELSAEQPHGKVESKLFDWFD